VNRSKRAAHHDEGFLVVNLDERHANASLNRCLAASSLTRAKFADLMGVSLRALADWLSGGKPIPRWALRAAYFAAISAGVPVRFPQPIVTREMLEAALSRPHKWPK
jgi:transcriptional regulator with XRE-family HTH domain